MTPWAATCSEKSKSSPPPRQSDRKQSAMAQETAQEASAASQRTKLDITDMIAIMALALSAVSFYRGYIYTKQQLDVTVTEVSYNTNQGALYMTVAFSNGGNKDAALLRIEAALWGRRDTPDLPWVPI